jgi:hypothetical protein
MKISFSGGWMCLILSISVLISGHAVAQGPFGAMGRGPRFDGHMAKLFGEHKAFTCMVDIEATAPDRPDAVGLTGQLAFSDGKSRFQMDLTKIRGGMTAGMVEQVKAMGMAELIIINRPDTGAGLLVYPGLKSYAKLEENTPRTDTDKYTIQSKELGREAVNGQDCIKNQVLVTAPDGKKFQSTVWNAPALKKFPVRVQSMEGGTPFTLTFKDVRFEKPAASLFDPPAAYTKYDDVTSLMRGAAMKKLGEPNKAPAK